VTYYGIALTILGLIAFAGQYMFSLIRGTYEINETESEAKSIPFWQRLTLIS